jgi:pyrroloquinoline quinone (PQQ) biosynthesis protein C
MKSTIIHTTTSFLSSREESLIQDLNLEFHLNQATSSNLGLQSFAKSFYFVRYDFVKLNFILGSRCSNNEILWSGLAKNLYEELGGKSGASHDQLYRDFLTSVGVASEQDMREPAFATEFNTAWENRCRNASIESAVAAIAIYEIFDKPDYQLLLRVMQNAEVNQRGLRFFQVHAVAEHFEMFEDTFHWLMAQENGKAVFEEATNFVFETQQKMWTGLIESLTSKNVDLVAS